LGKSKVVTATKFSS